MITCSRIFEFCASHRLMKHDGKCANLHGHNYRVQVKAMLIGKIEMNGNQMVVDFSILKEYIGGFIDMNWDHALLLNREDEKFKRINTPIYSFEGDPTAEMMAGELLHVICPELLQNIIPQIKVVEVSVWETEKCCATAKINT